MSREHYPPPMDMPRSAPNLPRAYIWLVCTVLIINWRRDVSLLPRLGKCRGPEPPRKEGTSSQGCLSSFLGILQKCERKKKKKGLCRELPSADSFAQNL